MPAAGLPAPVLFFVFLAVFFFFFAVFPGGVFLAAVRGCGLAAFFAAFFFMVVGGLGLALFDGVLAAFRRGVAAFGAFFGVFLDAVLARVALPDFRPDLACDFAMTGPGPGLTGRR